MKLSVVIMAHPYRAVQAYQLRRKLEYLGITAQTCMDSGNGEWENGKKAWLSHTDSDWSIVIQDDAIISSTFVYNVKKALENIPEPTCLSFYTGTVRPYKDKVERAVLLSKEKDASYLTSNQLLWGVCFAIPTAHIEAVIKYSSTPRYKAIPYDSRIGLYYKDHNKKVYYTNPSLVDHNNQLPSLTKHIVKQPRIAHNFLGEHIVDSWNSTTVDIGV